MGLILEAPGTRSYRCKDLDGSILRHFIYPQSPSHGWLRSPVDAQSPGALSREKSAYFPPASPTMLTILPGVVKGQDRWGSQAALPGLRTAREGAQGRAQTQFSAMVPAALREHRQRRTTQPPTHRCARGRGRFRAISVVTQPITRRARVTHRAGVRMLSGQMLSGQPSRNFCCVPPATRSRWGKQTKQLTCSSRT